MYVIKYHNNFQRNGQRKLSNHFCLTQIGSGRGRRRERRHMSDRISSMGLKSRRAKNGTNCIPAWPQALGYMFGSAA